MRQYFQNFNIINICVCMFKLCNTTCSSAVPSFWMHLFTYTCIHVSHGSVMYHMGACSRGRDEGEFVLIYMKYDTYLGQAASCRRPCSGGSGISAFFWVLLLQGLYVRKISTFHGSPLNNAFSASRSKSVLETNVQWTLSRLEDGLYLTRRLGICLSPIFFVLLT